MANLEFLLFSIKYKMLDILVFLWSVQNSRDVCPLPPWHGTARPYLADGEQGIHTRNVAANILDKQYRTVNKGWSYSFGGLSAG